jgi:hypothetical protein
MNRFVTAAEIGAGRPTRGSGHTHQPPLRPWHRPAVFADALPSDRSPEGMLSDQHRPSPAAEQDSAEPRAWVNLSGRTAVDMRESTPTGRAASTWVTGETGEKGCGIG